MADFVFSASSVLPTDTALSEEPYRQFLCNDAAEVTVCGHYGMPGISLREEERVFDSGAAWEAYRVEGKPVFALRAAVSDRQPYCVAVFSPDFRSGDVFYRVPYPGSEPGSLLMNPLTFPLFHLLMTSLLAQGYGVLIHACGIDDGGRGYLFTGSSTHGKTTMARIWKDEALVLNDERIVVRQREGRLWIFGTPWHGEYEGVSPKGALLEKVFFLGRGDINTVRPQHGAAAASKLLTHCFLPFWDEKGMRFVLDFCAGLVQEVPCGELGFVPDSGIIEFVRSEAVGTYRIPS